MVKSYENAKQQFLNSTRKPIQASANPNNQFQSAGLRQIEKSLNADRLRPVTDSQTDRRDKK